MSNPFRVAILICSDRAFSGKRKDACGAVLAARCRQAGWEVSDLSVIADDAIEIARWLSEMVRSTEIDLILTSGGTGVSARDVTPEATLEVIEKRVPGIEEEMRAQSIKITPHAMLSRAVAGIADNTLIINLPGSPKGALENLEIAMPAIPHAIALLRGEKPDL